MPASIATTAAAARGEEEDSAGDATESSLSPPPSSSHGTRSSPRRGRRTLGLDADYSEAPFYLVDPIKGDLEESFEFTSMTPERLRAIQEQLIAVAPDLANMY
jgi:hypothetical protein